MGGEIALKPSPKNTENIVRLLTTKIDYPFHEIRAKSILVKQGIYGH